MSDSDDNSDDDSDTEANEKSGKAEEIEDIKDELLVSIKNEDSIRKSSFPISSNDFKCNFCKLVLSSQRGLERHIADVHQTIWPVLLRKEQFEGVSVGDHSSEAHHLNKPCEKNLAPKASYPNVFLNSFNFIFH